MTLIDLPRAPITLELDDIQATVLRYRPEPYYGTHVMLHVNDAHSGREFLRRLAPYVDSAAEWWQADQPWIAVALTYAGLVALGLPEDSLQSFPEAFRAGMAARAGSFSTRSRTTRRTGSRRSAAGSSTSASACSAIRATRGAGHGDGAAAGGGRVGLTVVATEDFGAQPGDLNPLGYKDSIGQPAVEGSGVESLPGQGRPIKAGELILGYPGEAGVPLPMPSPDVLGRNGPSPGCASTSPSSGRSTAS